MTSDEDVYERCANLLEADVHDELVALDPERGTCFGFNSVATVVWKKLEQPRSFADLKAELMNEFDVSEAECGSDLRDLLSELSKAGLVKPAGFKGL